MIRHLGIVADDVTGATDVAGAVSAAGRRVALVLGVPDGPLPEADDWVIALTTRQAPPDQAVTRTIAAVRHLLAAGADLIYQKYCSTFDSTDAGNIGPVGDALLALAERDGGRPVLVGTPATPRAGRQVRDGVLFVHGVPLADSPMRHHPVTPMRDSDLVRLLRRQSHRPVRLIPPGGGAGWLEEVDAAVGGAALLDAADDDALGSQAATLVAGRGAWPDTVVAGAAGWAGALAAALGPGEPRTDSPSRRAGRRLILAGSCSERTRQQVEAFSGPSLRVAAESVMADPTMYARLLTAADAHWDEQPGRPVLVSSSVDPRRAASDQRRFGVAPLARAFERCFADVARRAVSDHGVTTILAAGGETSGAITGALGVHQLWVGHDVAPGVPWTITPDGIALLLKSGNFGPVDLFDTAWEALGD